MKNRFIYVLAKKYYVIALRDELQAAFGLYDYMHIVFIQHYLTNFCFQDF